MFSLMSCIGTWPGPSIITWQSWRQAMSVSSPRVFSSAIWASSLASWIEPGRRPSPSEKLISYAVFCLKKKNEQRVHAFRRIPNHDVTASGCVPDDHETNQADDHPRRGRHDGLQRR